MTPHFDKAPGTKLIRAFALRAAALALILSAAGSAFAQAPPAGQFVTGNSAFALSLYGQLAKANGNIFFSPYSVSTAMAMVYCGAGGNTAAEMKTALDFPYDQSQLPSLFQALGGELAADAQRDKQQLEIANGLCLTNGDVSQQYKTLLQQQFAAAIFHGDVNTINTWVSQKTGGKIGKLLDELNANSNCVLLNAIYFKGTWAAQFAKGDTYAGPFNVSEATQVTVPFMSRTSNYQLLDEQGFQAISIPYRGQDLSMVILLPSSANGLPQLEQQLTSQNLLRWLAELDGSLPQQVSLQMPKYTLATKYDLVPPFKQLGIHDAFSAAADFSGMGAPKGGLYISQIIHAAFLQVDEKGTEAAAATAIEMGSGAAAAPPVTVFKVDHPFLLLIRHKRTGTLLFLGRVVNPAEG